jgi:metallophosphoesterase superfamily enzyme
MKRIVVIGDFHLKSSEPHWTGQKKLLNYFREKYHDCTLIFTGDLFDTSSPRWEVFTEFLLFCKMFEGEIHIVHGNHEYSRLGGFSGELDDIVSNELTSASAIVTISDSDKGFKSAGCGTWTKM